MHLHPTTDLTPFSQSNRTLVFLLVFGCLFSLAAGIAPLVVWGVTVGFCLLFWCFNATLKGLVLVVALSSMFVRSTEEITVFEVGYALLLGVVLMGWGFRRKLIGQTYSQSPTDRLLIWFLLICVASILPAIGQGNDPVKWLRELVPFLLFLPYFVVVTLLQRKAEIRWFCVAYLILCVTMGFINVYDYWTNISDARQQWELIAGRRAPGEPLFFTTLTIAMLMLVYQGIANRRSVIYLGIIAFCTVALAITFSRGYWVAAAIAIGCAFYYMRPIYKKRLIFYLGSMLVIAAAVILFFMGQLIIDIITVMGDRLASVFSAAVDLSFRNRMAESAAVIDLIIASPIWGYGLGYYFNFHPLIPYLTPTWYIHNVYLYLWLKLGIFGLMVFMIWYGTVIRHAWICARRIKDPFLQPLIIGIMCLMIAMIPLSITSPQFIQKDSILFLAIGTGIIERIYRSDDWSMPLEA